MTKPGKTKDPINGDALFEAAMRDARPLKRRPACPPRGIVETASAAAKTGTAARPVSKGRARPAPAPVQRQPASAVTAVAKTNGGLDKRSAERLRRGQIAIEGRLDLHGHTQADAHRAVHAFIAGSYRAGRRCVLIITGKGGPRDNVDSGFMPDRDSGVLRRNLPRWLGEGTVRQMVLRIETARPQHGGEGACYVLLRRKR
ncbi:MAG: Smr/MutS family protein [Proteobacteria bacterium]|nr:Smr/MutS family protein [Pseudomonadota bacterium]